ncbi:MAG TPA: DnaJ domain-containing protein [Verrucomicrobiaceae bacterium]|jgi:curved DNA-binding protein CbpA
MTDAFAILGLPRQAALDGESLRQAYAARSRAAHPDHGGDEQQAAEVNQAYETLRAPEKRLRHLLELVAPKDEKQWRTVPMDESMMSHFSMLGKALESSAKFLERKHEAQSAIAKALLASGEMQHREALERIGMELEGRRIEMEARLSEIDAALHANDATIWKQVAILQARFAYLGKWQTQIRERLILLM